MINKQKSIPILFELNGKLLVFHSQIDNVYLVSFLLAFIINVFSKKGFW